MIMFLLATHCMFFVVQGRGFELASVELQSPAKVQSPPERASPLTEGTWDDDSSLAARWTGLAVLAK